jgi:hypothetical protein
MTHRSSTSWRQPHGRASIAALLGAAALLVLLSCGDDSTEESAADGSHGVPSRTSTSPSASTSPERTENGGAPASSGNGAAHVCLSCVAGPPSGVEAQFGYFTGGASDLNCEGVLTEVLDVPEGEPYAGIRAARAVRGTHAWFCVSGFREDVPVDVNVVFPDGARRHVEWHGGAGHDQWMDLIGDTTISVHTPLEVVWPVHPGSPLGTYQVTAEQRSTESAPSTSDSSTVKSTTTSSTEPADSPSSPPPTTTLPKPSTTKVHGLVRQTERVVTAHSTFTVVDASEPSVQASPPQRQNGELLIDVVHDPGSTVQFLFAGFQPGSEVSPLVYFRAADDSCDSGSLCFTAELPPVRVDGTGTLRYELATSPEDREGLYCLTTIESHSCERNTQEGGFGGEFFLGEPSS